MCVRLSTIGIPLEDLSLDDMPVEEKLFWRSFMELVEKERFQAKSIPFKPSSALLNKYAEAVRNHDGEAFCRAKGIDALFLLS